MDDRFVSGQHGQIGDSAAHGSSADDRDLANHGRGVYRSGYDGRPKGGDAMSMVKEFKEFALKGNVIDLAIAVVLGAAFAKIVSSFVSDILMPLLGVVIGKHDLSDYFFTLSPGHYETLAQAKAAGAATLNYGI